MLFIVTKVRKLEWRPSNLLHRDVKAEDCTYSHLRLQRVKRKKWI